MGKQLENGEPGGVSFLRGFIREAKMVIERIVLAAGLAAILGFTSSGPTLLAEQDATPESKETCCFKNPAYSGVCKVQPVEDETCANILAYLNNPMAQGKSYCGGTKVRQGWAEVDCEDDESEDSVTAKARSLR